MSRPRHVSPQKVQELRLRKKGMGRRRLGVVDHIQDIA